MPRLFVAADNIIKEKDLDFGFEGDTIVEIQIVRRFKLKMTEDFKPIIPEAK